jgi:hypothetical protein
MLASATAPHSWFAPDRANQATELAKGTRACLLTADAVMDHDGGERDATEVGQGVLVVAGRDSAPLFFSRLNPRSTVLR